MQHQHRWSAGTPGFSVEDVEAIDIDGAISWRSHVVTPLVSTGGFAHLNRNKRNLAKAELWDERRYSCGRLVQQALFEFLSFDLA